jgi:ribose 1,5-bisphosphate isomerase
MKYPKEIEQLHKEIEDIKIQGATNVAIATLKGIKLALQFDYPESTTLIDTIIDIGNYLAYARPNEPMAQNAVLYIEYLFNENGVYRFPIEEEKQLIEELCDDFLKEIENEKKKLLELNVPKLLQVDHVLTHCHSSTAVSLIIGISKGDKDFTAVCTETRPRYQGRKTAVNLLEAGINTTLIADSAAESFVIGRGSKSVSTVFIGCDAITMKGHCINKIGSWGIAMAAYESGKKLYVVTPLLKIDHDTAYHEIKIEIREDSELWEDAPKGLEMYNPAFEVVDAQLISGFITEFGILKPQEIEDFVRKQYPWLFYKKEKQLSN